MDTFVYTAQMANGTLSLAKVTLTVTGPLNHAPVLASVAPVEILDDSAPAAAVLVEGQLKATDADAGAVLRYALAPGSTGTSAYGTFELDATGLEWRDRCGKLPARARHDAGIHQGKHAHHATCWTGVLRRRRACT